MTKEPDSREGKKEQVRQMFDHIANRYDFLNHFLSLGIDRLWRKKLIRILRGYRHERILDVATGTGDLAIAAAKLHPKKITGVDISEQMLRIGIEKVRVRKLENVIEMQAADSEHLPFDDNAFDAVMVAFGVRNFENLSAGLSEMQRVIRPGGVALILEFSMPERFPVRQLYKFYFRRILPLLGKFISGDSRAYTYLPESVGKFPYGHDFLEIMKKSGFTGTGFVLCSAGIATIYTGRKPD